jgi:hypothetical protein
MAEVRPLVRRWHCWDLSPETWGSLAGALLFWRCPDDYEALRG